MATGISNSSCDIGHFGTVYKAFLKTGTSPGECVKVAVKGIKHETEKEKNNFIREMSVMSKMLHPNIVRLYGLVLRGLLTL